MSKKSNHCLYLISDSGVNNDRFKKYPILGILVYGLLLISCLLELSVELGIHEFDDFASHHGLAIFALGSLFANWDDLSKALKNFKNQKNKEAPKEPL